MIAALDRVWRLLATGISFSLFGLGGLVMALIVFPAMTLFIRDRARREEIAQASVHQVWALFIWIMKTLGVLTYECHGKEKLRADRGVIVVANHPSLIDVVFLMSFMRRSQAVVKEGVWRNPFMAGVVRATNYIPNLGDPERLVADCAAVLRAGKNLCIFPEGSRTVPGRPRRYQRGFAYAAIEANAPIRLCTIVCDPPTLLKGEPWHRIPRRRPHWKIVVHERIEPPADTGYEKGPMGVRKLTAEVERRIEELLRA